MSNFYSSLYSANNKPTVSIQTQDGDGVVFANASMDDLVQQEFDFSGQAGDGSRKTPSTLSSHEGCHAKDPVHCPHHGVPEASKADGLKKEDPDSSSASKPKMTREEYTKAMRGWLSKASEDQLRDFLKKIDDGKHELALKLFDEEVTRRSIRDNESKNGGEWM
jgi:hypothetical protein